MKYFKNLAAKNSLIPYLKGEFDDQFILKNEKHNLVIHHFNEKIVPDGIKNYLEIANVILDFIASHDSLNEYISLEKIQEAGVDYFVIPHHPGRLFSSLSKIEEWHEEDKPEELVLMREAVTKVCSNCSGSKENMVAEILKSDLLEPTGRTYFDEHIYKFIISEPGIKPEHLKIWPTIKGSQ